MVKNIFVLFTVLLSTHIALGQTINASASKVNFEISNMGFKMVDGTFDGMAGTIQFDAQDLGNSQFDVCIKAESVNTGNKKRDGHLRKEDYFYVEKYPTICFQSSSISKTAEGFNAAGTMTMRGISKEVTIPFTFANNTFAGTLSLERKDYDVGPNGGFMVGKTVDLKITCVVE